MIEHERMRSGAKFHELRATPTTCFWGFLDRTLAPVLTIRSGDFIQVQTLTHRAGDAPDLMMDDVVRAVYEGIPPARRGPAGHIMTGPVAIEGAAPGDTLEVRILAMAPRVPYGSSPVGRWGYLFEDFRTERITVYRLDAAAGLAHAAFAFDHSLGDPNVVLGEIVPPESVVREPTLQGIVIPMRPHFGVIGVAPPDERRISSGPPGDHGGNVDNWRIGVGTTMYYPVFVPEAKLYIGDPHMAQGDGEMAGAAIESSADGVIQVTVRKDFPVEGPVLETSTHWHVHGFGADLDEAMRSASRRLVAFVSRGSGLSPHESYSLVSVAGDFTVTQAVDGRLGIHGSIPKHLFTAGFLQ